MKRKSKPILIMLCIFLLFHFIPYAQAENIIDTQPEYHFVVVYDVSRSMNDSDDSRQIRDMVALFLDKIRSDMFPAKFAILPFAGTCPAVNTLASPSGADWWDLESYNSPSIPKLKKLLGDLDYSSNDTNIGQALQTCNQLLSQMREDNDNCIQVVLFMTDGFPDIDESTNSKKFQSIYDSYLQTKTVAELFPVDVYFLGIVPDAESRESVLTYNDDHSQITKYYGYNVPEQYGESMIQVSQGMREFCEILAGRQQNQRYPADIREINWKSADAVSEVDKIYKEFFEQVFSASTTEKTQQNLKQGVKFIVPETLSEINITIIPDAETPAERQAAVQKCAQDLTVSIEESTCAPFITDSKNAVTAKIIDPEAGEYTLQSETITSATLRFYAYGALQIVPFESQVEGVAGEQVSISGQIINGAQKPLSESAYQYITFSVIGNHVDAKQTCQDGNWNVTFTPQEPGEYYITLEIDYDDTAFLSDGITHFYATTSVLAMITEAVATESPSESKKPSVSNDPWPSVAPEEPQNPPPNTSPVSWHDVIPYLLGAILLLVLVFIIKLLRRQKFTVILEDGTRKKISVPKKRNIFVETRIKGLEIRYIEQDNWQYVYNGGEQHQIVDNTIKLFK